MPDLSARSDGRPLVLVLDIGTSGVKGLLLTPDGDAVGRAHVALSKSFPKRGWVEQDPMEIVSASRAALRAVVEETRTAPERIVACGLANQRETVVAWYPNTGRPYYPAVGWEDSRTARLCRDLAADPEKAETVRQKTGLPIIPYFSASKLQWLQQKGRLGSSALVGTVDTWVLWNLVEGAPHVTEPTNAARTLLFDVRKGDWSDDLVSLFGVSRSRLPAVLPSRSTFGFLKEDVVGALVPVRAVLGDQQSSTYAAGTAPGTTKVTYGTGIFLVQVIGPKFALHEPFFTTLVAGPRSPWYAVEAAVGVGGARVTPVLDDPARLRRVLTKMARETAAWLRRLPIQPTRLVLDGGIAQAGELLRTIQEQEAGIPCELQRLYDGTALGVGMLAAEAWRAEEGRG